MSEMNRSRVAAMVLGVMALCLAAFSAPAAQAEPNAKWLILMEDNEVLTGAELHARGQFSPETENGALVTHILGLTVEVTCKSGELLKGELIETGSLSESTAKFTGCKTLLSGEVNTECAPHTTGQPSGTIETLPFLGLIVLHELVGIGQDDLIRIKTAAPNNLFYLIEFGKTCVLGTKVSVNGVLYLKDCENKLLQHLVNHLVEQAPLTRMWVISETKEHLETTIRGSAVAFLLGQHLNLAWSGMAA
jgi:hypothetical protein